MKLYENFWNFVKFAIETFIEFSSDFKKPKISELYPLALSALFYFVQSSKLA